jgi:hypothetical protein
MGLTSSPPPLIQHPRMQYQSRRPRGMSAGNDISNPSTSLLLPFTQGTYANNKLHDLMSKQRWETKNEQDNHRNNPRPSLSLLEPIRQRLNPALERIFIHLEEDDEHDRQEGERYNPTPFAMSTNRSWGSRQDT